MRSWTSARLLPVVVPFGVLVVVDAEEVGAEVVVVAPVTTGGNTWSRGRERQPPSRRRWHSRKANFPKALLVDTLWNAPPSKNWRRRGNPKASLDSTMTDPAK